ncbi:DUF4097 family beta strand repeat-containing protein [Streptomyces sp. NBC_00083]|uniref:DUF4097 family beta strand repeat-containing protein n=1 Tax=Streptomyces sp. NBC_00083 TaxID=2975647 RepID=UPI00225A634C|nr:DUF4097 family beta strand repeat-containing protein [Streptomyces sp. NBC_00083]MCX5382696.1 DUF4097 domain-containing protein [Streptomyces sp. NBC_00083]
MAFRRRSTLLAAGGAGLLAFALTGCGSSDASDAPVEHKNFAFAGQALTIEAGASTLVVTPSDVKDVEVDRQVDGWAVFGSGPDASWALDGHTLNLTVKCGGVIKNCEARHTVKVPRGVAVTVHDADGRVEASGFDTPLKIACDNGRVTVKDSSGPLDVTSDNGRIDGEGIRARSVRAGSDSGRVALTFAVVPDSVVATSDDGRVDLSVPRATYKVAARSDDGRVDVNVDRSDSSTHVLSARSDDGRVTIRHS